MPKINLNISRKVFNDVYYPFLNDDTYLQIFFGGSSSGKSYFLAQRCVLDVVKGGHNYLITRKVARTLRGSVFNEIKKAISFFKLNAYFKINESDMIITCGNGYQILFAGLDDVEKKKSITPAKEVITDIWVEEATECEYKDVKQLRKRLRGISKVKKRIILSFNPILQTHWIYTEHFKNWIDGNNELREPRTTILKTTYKDNKFLAPEDIEELESETDQYYYNVYTLGNWGVLGGVIFKNWRMEDLSEFKKTCSKFNNGGDFGYAEDPATGVKTHYDRKHNRLYVLEEFYEHGLTNKDLAKGLKPIFGNDMVVFDCAEPKSITELCQYGISAVPARKGKDSVKHGIQWMQQQEIIIDISCQHTKNEFQSYKWREDKDGNILPEPVDRNNHIIDPIRYANELEMHYWLEQQKQKEKPRDYDKYERMEDDGSWMAV
jgi:phage terminase large subunit